MRDHWRRNGPPVNIAVVAIAASLGIDLTGEAEEPAGAIVEDTIDGPSIADLAALVPAAVGHDTSQASRLIAERLRHAAVRS